MESHLTTFDQLTDRELLARCIWGEARGEPVEGKLAVANVVLNRKGANAYYGHSIKEVILKRWQFSCFNENDPNLHQILNLSSKDPTLAYCQAIADAVIFERQTGIGSDPSGGATHYHTVQGKRPAWADKMPFLRQVGSHLFYRESLRGTEQVSDEAAN